MSLLDTASLIVTPNGYKAGTLYSVIPNTTLGDLSVTRATTATRVNSSGLIESVASNVPRLDYSNGTCPSILVEPQRTNLVTYSSQFDDASWSKTSVSVTANSTISPDGTLNADTITSTSTSGDPQIIKNLTISTNTTYSYSFYIKKDNNESRFPEFLLRTEPISYIEQYIQLNTKTGATVIRYATSGTSHKVESFGDYWRLTLTNVSLLDTGIRVGIRPAATNVIGTYNPQIGSIIAWGAQVEAGSYATSYIPTTSASVTRNADVINKTGISSLIGQTEGTVFFDIRLDTISAQTNDPVLWYMKDGGTGERYVELFDNGNLSYIEFNGAVIANITKSGLTVGRHKCAIAYANNDMTFYVDGVQIGTGTSGTPSGFSEFGLQYYNTEFYGQQKVNTIALWKTRLTNTQLATLTTI
jgi:hypothetical protein